MCGPWEEGRQESAGVKRAHRHIEEACTPRMGGDRRPLRPPSQQKEGG